MKRVLYAAAHSGFNLGHVPLGGGAAVCQHLVEEWNRQKPFELEVLGPSILDSAPQQEDLVHYSELEYARFCRRFETRLTEIILKHDPANTIILCNDVSEGPDFKMLAAKGYSLYTIYHVDVVDYFTTIYLRSWLKPEATTALYRKLRQFGLAWLVPDVLKLVWDKQEASVLYSKGLIVPSERMKEVLLRSYPELAPERVHVLPWGVWEETVPPQDVQREKENLLKKYLVSPDAWKLLMLSRISPEKGQDRVLKALALWEKQAEFPQQGVTVFLAGESAYMMGKKYENKLKKLAAQLKKCRVFFVGYAVGSKKKALFELSDLYVFPSKHESYGLTLLEALREGKPVLVTPSHGAKEVFQAEFGEMIPEGDEAAVPEFLVAGLRHLLSDRSGLKAKGHAAAAWASGHHFSEAASKLSALLRASQ